jgi:Ca-activated chloride channel family protein
MSLKWPWMLVLFVGAVPLLALEYRRLLRRRASRRAELAALGLVAPAPVSSGIRRHVAPALFLAALAMLFLALARPEATVVEPRREGTVVLAFDVSGSMAATDLAPNRLAAAKSAARAFVEKQPSTIRVGVVAFGESALITQRPTTDRAAVLGAIARLTPQGGTSLGRGIQTALSAITGKTVQLDNSTGSIEATGPDLGFHRSAVVIMLTDGENTAEPDPVQVAEVSSTAGVRVYPIGLGSPQGTVLEIDGFQVATALDEPLLREIASTTDGEYFAAADEQALTKVYGSIPLGFTVEPRRMEVTALFALGAAMLLALGAGLSFLWFGRVI